MAKYRVFKLHFLTPLHIGLGRSTYDFASSELHSDTLTSALAALKAQHGASSQEIAEFLDGLSLSSAFPFADDIYFLPKPLSVDQIEVEGKDSTEYRKKLKKVQYIDSRVWPQFITSGQVPKVRPLQLHDEFLTAGEVEEFKTPYRKQVNQRVAVSRSGEEASEPFYFEWLYFDEQRDCGFYVITDAQGPLLAELESLLKELGETGVGTDKTVGGGQFTVTTDDIELPDSESADCYISLSLFLPSLAENTAIDLRESCYELMLRGGYMAGSSQESLRHLWKKSVYMYKEGSTFVTTDEPKGTVVNLSPEWNDPAMHPVYRSGKALFIPFQNR